MVLWVVVGIDPTLSAVEARGGIHSVRPSLRFRVVQPPFPTRRLSGPQARVSSSMLVSPSSAIQPSTWWT